MHLDFCIPKLVAIARWEPYRQSADALNRKTASRPLGQNALGTLRRSSVCYAPLDLENPSWQGCHGSGITSRGRFLDLANPPGRFAWIWDAFLEALLGSGVPPSWLFLDLAHPPGGSPGSGATSWRPFLDLESSSGGSSWINKQHNNNIFGSRYALGCDSPTDKIETGFLIRLTLSYQQRPS